jgi:hypothetical protein
MMAPAVFTRGYREAALAAPLPCSHQPSTSSHSQLSEAAEEIDVDELAA